MSDRNGHTIPRMVEGGQFRWFIHSGGQLIGRAEMLSVSRGISSSYSCNTPCPPRFDHGYTDPDPTTVPVGDSEAKAVLEIDVDSYNNQYGPYSATVVAATTFDTGIATFDGYSVSGVGMGDTTTAATVEYALYILEAGNDCYPYGTLETDIYGSVVAGTISVGTITVSPTTINSSTDATVSIPLSTSSGVSSTQGTTVEVSITDSSGPSFSLTFTPTGAQPVNLSGGQSQTFTFGVHLANAPTSTATCKFAAHLNPRDGLMVTDNDKKTETTLTISP